ncbi:MAG: hypothetical protein IJY90_03510 [Clostridia bacterium]|nr:hypothetical protein [Clostridia bacterium]
MKKSVVGVLLGICVAVCAFVGCENSTDVIASYISESTSAGSENYGVKITYADDSRLEGKGVDTQVKFSKRGEITIWEEGGTKFTYKIEDYDEWYSMTVILAEAKGNGGEEQFERFDEVIAKSFYFSSDQSQEVTFRAVVGDIEQNSASTGEILVGSEAISNQFTLKMNKKS